MNRLTFSLGEKFGLPPKAVKLDAVADPKDGQLHTEPCPCGRAMKVFEAHGGKWVSQFSIFDGGIDFGRYGTVSCCRLCQEEQEQE